MTIEERVELYKSLYKECKALEPVAWSRFLIENC